MPAKKYNEEQIEALEKARQSYHAYKFAKQDLEKEIRDALEKRIEGLKMTASYNANVAIEAGVTNADIRRIVSTNWNMTKDFLALTKGKK